MRLRFKCRNLTCRSWTGRIFCPEINFVRVGDKKMFTNTSTHSSNVNGCPIPAYDILIPVLFSGPEKYWSMRPLAPSFPRWRFRSRARLSSRSWSEPSSARRHVLYLDAFKELGALAVPKIFKQSMSVLSGISTAAFST